MLMTIHKYSFLHIYIYIVTCIYIINIIRVMIDFMWKKLAYRGGL